MKQKANLEFHAVQNFIAEYNGTHIRQLHYLRACIPPMPDTLCHLNRKEIGIEVVHTYGTGVEAALRLGNREIKDFRDEIHRARRKIGLDIRALNSLDVVLADKATRTYGFEPTWLLVRNAFAPWSLSDYRRRKKQIRVPVRHPFTQIWFLCDGTSLGVPGIMRLA